MKYALVLLAVIPLHAADVAGTWKAHFVGPLEGRPKMVTEMTFELKVEGDKVTGMAHMADWPGDAPVSEGKIQGNVLSFTVVGRSPWQGNGPQGPYSGYPRLEFQWTLEGTEAQVALNWGSVMIRESRYDAGAPPGSRIQGKVYAEGKGPIRRSGGSLSMRSVKQPN